MFSYIRKNNYVYSINNSNINTTLSNKKHKNRNNDNKLELNNSRLFYIHI